jgi:hypothetical protein
VAVPEDDFFQFLQWPISEHIIDAEENRDPNRITEINSKASKGGLNRKFLTVNLEFVYNGLLWLLFG